MPSFKKLSASRLSTFHRDLQVLFFEVIKSFDCTFIEPQEISFKSYIINMAPKPVEWENIKEFYYFAGYVMATARKLKDEGKMTHSIRWLGDQNTFDHLDNQKLNDLVRFELMI